MPISTSPAARFSPVIMSSCHIRRQQNLPDRTHPPASGPDALRSTADQCRIGLQTAFCNAFTIEAIFSRIAVSACDVVGGRTAVLRRHMRYRPLISRQRRHQCRWCRVYQESWRASPLVPHPAPALPFDVLFIVSLISPASIFHSCSCNPW